MKINNINLYLFVFIAYILLFHCKNSFCNEQNNKNLFNSSLYDISKNFFGKNYLMNNDDKNNNFKEPAIFRTDNFDCLTFVETVLGYHISKDFDELMSNLKKIKYKDGNVDFFSRNHFMTSDWIPNNSWLLKNITTEITDNYETKIVLLNKKSWFIIAHKNYYNYLVSKNQINKIEKFGNTRQQKVKYIPYKTILNNGNFLEKIPKESIVFIVKDLKNMREKIGTELDVSHVGFLFKRKNKFYKYSKFADKYNLIFRHASSIEKKIVDIDFKKYIENNIKKSNTFQGIIVLTLNKKYE